MATYLDYFISSFGFISFNLQLVFRKLYFLIRDYKKNSLKTKENISLINFYDYLAVKKIFRNLPDKIDSKDNFDRLLAARKNIKQLSAAISLLSADKDFELTLKKNAQIIFNILIKSGSKVDEITQLIKKINDSCKKNGIDKDEVLKKLAATKTESNLFVIARLSQALVYNNIWSVNNYKKIISNPGGSLSYIENLALILKNLKDFDIFIDQEDLKDGRTNFDLLLNNIANLDVQETIVNTFIETKNIGLFNNLDSILQQKLFRIILQSGKNSKLVLIALSKLKANKQLQILEKKYGSNQYGHEILLQVGDKVDLLTDILLIIDEMPGFTNTASSFLLKAIMNYGYDFQSLADFIKLIKEQDQSILTENNLKLMFIFSKHIKDIVAAFELLISSNCRALLNSESKKKYFGLIIIFVASGCRLVSVLDKLGISEAGKSLDYLNQLINSPYFIASSIQQKKLNLNLLIEPDDRPRIRNIKLVLECIAKIELIDKQLLTPDVLTLLIRQSDNLEPLLQQLKFYNYEYDGAVAWSEPPGGRSFFSSLALYSRETTAELIALDLEIKLAAEKNFLGIEIRRQPDDIHNTRQAKGRIKKIKDLYDQKFKSPPFNGDVKMVEQLLQESILKEIKKQAEQGSDDKSSELYEPNKRELISFLTTENIQEIIYKNNKSLRKKALKLFTSIKCPAQIAWRCFDPDAPRQGFANLLIEHTTTGSPLFGYTGLDGRIGASCEVRESLSLLYLVATDKEILGTDETTEDKLLALIGVIANIRRALNDDGSFDPNGKDAQSCYPGTMQRLATWAFLNHPIFDKRTSIENLIYHQIKMLAQRRLDQIVDNFDGVYSTQKIKEIYYGCLILGLGNSASVINGNDKFAALSSEEINLQDALRARSAFLLSFDYYEILSIIMDDLAYKRIEADQKTIRYLIIKTLLDLSGLNLSLNYKGQMKISEQSGSPLLDSPASLTAPTIDDLKLEYGSLGTTDERKQFLKHKYIPFYKALERRTLLDIATYNGVVNADDFVRDVVEERFSYSNPNTIEQLHDILRDPARGYAPTVARLLIERQQIFGEGWNLPEWALADYLKKGLDNLEYMQHSAASIDGFDGIAIRRVRLSAAS